MMKTRMLFALVVCSLSACSVTTIKTSGDSSPSATGSKPSVAHVGSSITLKSNNSGERVKVTVMKVVDPARSSDQYTAPAKGNRYVAIQIRLQNVGTAVYDDSPSNGTKLIDAASQQYDADITDPVAPGLGSVKMSSGGARVGYITFEIPKSAKPASFQFALDSGFGPETGEWIL